MTTTPDPADAADAALEQALRDSRRLEDAPEHVIQRALAAWRPRGAPGAAHGLLRRMLATIAENGASGFAPAFGVRGAAPAGQQWLFRADECEIDLRTAPRGERWTVTGQLFGALQAERVVLEGGAQPVSIELGPTREFSFADLPAGLYSLTVRGGECEVVIPQFEVGATGTA